MLQSKWILSLFFLTMLQFEAATTEKTRYLVQAHSEATLHCENEKLGQKQCKGTTWIFSGKTSRAAVELILLGEIKEKSGRQSLSENCSLVINNVTAEDAGFYTCQQWRGTKESTGNVKLAEDSVYLSVVTVTGQWKNDLVTLRCSVSTVGDCPYTVEWQHGGRDIDVRTSTSSCSASQTFSRPCDDWSRFQPLRCRVKNKTGIEKKFFNPPSICETPGGADSVTSPKTTAKTPTTARATTAPTLKTSIHNKKSPSTTARLTATPAAGPNLIQHWLFYIAGAAAVFVAVAAAVVIGWKIKRKRRSKEKADIVAKDPEDLLSYATIGFTRSGTDANLHHKDLVTYSTVRDASSCTSSSAVHVDPNALYAQINKP